jgi:hypothetical protein
LVFPSVYSFLVSEEADADAFLLAALNITGSQKAEY